MRPVLAIVFNFSKRDSADPSPLGLGHLESAAMEVLWARGESNVREVAAQVGRPLAYTTVMTTLDRLYKKGLLERRKVERAFLYSPRLTRDQLEKQRALEVMDGFLDGSSPVRELLISCLLETAGPQDDAALEELEQRIRSRRLELRRRREP